ncbi:MAG: CinA family nicotinamide mononucleotide deamidase-related protein [Bacteroidia bacterium]
MNIHYISIGDELLRGRIVNTNAQMLALKLRPAGFDLNQIITIGDEPETIVDTVRAELEKADVLILTGGLGPTKDDMTKHTLAEMFGMKLEWHQPTVEYLERRYAEFKRVLNDPTRRQALMPDGCTVLRNNHGTAPGMLFMQGEKMIFSLPGVPFEMGHLVDEQVLPRLIDSSGQKQYFLQHVLRVTDLPESEAAERLQHIHDEFPPNMKLAYLPRKDGLWLEFQASGPVHAEEADTEIFNSFKGKIAAAVSECIYAEGVEDLPVILGKRLVEKGLSLATAESLTAGILAGRIVEASGSSRYYKGGIVAYETAQKTALLDVPEAIIEKHTVVSQAVVSAMAEGARKKLGADIGLATTGFAEAEPGQSFPHAWIAVATPDKVHVRHVRLYGDRNHTRMRCAEMLMVLALKCLGGFDRD